MINSTRETLSVHSLLQAHRFGSYLVSTNTTNCWSAGPGMPLLLHCFLHFHPTASTMVHFIFFFSLSFCDSHDPNVPCPLRHGMSAVVNLSLQPHYCHLPHSQGQIYSVIMAITATELIKTFQGRMSSVT